MATIRSYSNEDQSSRHSLLNMLRVVPLLFVVSSNTNLEILTDEGSQSTALLLPTLAGAEACLC